MLRSKARAARRKKKRKKLRRADREQLIYWLATSSANVYKKHLSYVSNVYRKYIKRRENSRRGTDLWNDEYKERKRRFSISRSLERLSPPSFEIALSRAAAWQRVNAPNYTNEIFHLLIDFSPNSDVKRRIRRAYDRAYREFIGRLNCAGESRQRIAPTKNATDELWIMFGDARTDSVINVLE